MPVDISLAIEKKSRRVEDDREPDQLVTPGDIITRDTYMRGHGSYMKDDVLYASVAGLVDRGVLHYKSPMENYTELLEKQFY